jgi:Ca-activated chloride channel family protein
MFDYQFRNPEFFWLALLILPVIAFWAWKWHQQNSSLQYANAQSFLNKRSWRARMIWVPKLLVVLAWISMVIAMARPQTTDSRTVKTSTEGIDMVLSMDVSTSMKAMDFRPNRLQAAVDVATQFVGARPQDRFGVVVYAGESFTQCPLTTDHRIVQTTLSEITFGLIEDGTAIGMGLATAVNRLKDSKAKSKVIILMSDGVNNAGSIDPKTAAELASKFGIRVYTIGVGTMGMARVPVQYPNGREQIMSMQVEIDEELLGEIAGMTGGKYFRATDKEKLSAIYEEIDQLEKTKLNDLTYNTYEEKFIPFLLAALALIFLEIFWRKWWFKSIDG